MSVVTAVAVSTPCSVVSSTALAAEDDSEPLHAHRDNLVKFSDEVHEELFDPVHPRSDLDLRLWRKGKFPVSQRNQVDNTYKMDKEWRKSVRAWHPCFVRGHDLACAIARRNAKELAEHLKHDVSYRWPRVCGTVLMPVPQHRNEETQLHIETQGDFFIGRTPVGEHIAIPSYGSSDVCSSDADPSSWSVKRPRTAQRWLKRSALVHDDSGNESTSVGGTSPDEWVDVSDMDEQDMKCTQSVIDISQASPWDSVDLLNQSSDGEAPPEDVLDCDSSSDFDSSSDNSSSGDASPSLL